MRCLLFGLDLERLELELSSDFEQIFAIALIAFVPGPLARPPTQLTLVKVNSKSANSAKFCGNSGEIIAPDLKTV